MYYHFVQNFPDLIILTKSFTMKKHVTVLGALAISLASTGAVSYTHLTLPTIYSV